MSQKSFETIKKEIAAIEEKISDLSVEKGKLKLQIQEVCPHNNTHDTWSSKRCSDSDCDKAVQYFTQKIPTAF